MIKFSSIQFFVRNATISRERNFTNTVQKVERKLLETAEYWSMKKHLISWWAELLSKNYCWQAGVYCQKNRCGDAVPGNC